MSLLPNFVKNQAPHTEMETDNENRNFFRKVWRRDHFSLKVSSLGHHIYPTLTQWTSFCGVMQRQYVQN